MHKIELAPYSFSDNEEALKLEHLCPQGGDLSLKFVRPTFSARSEVYENYRIVTAKVGGRLIGITAAAKKKSGFTII